MIKDDLKVRFAVGPARGANDPGSLAPLFEGLERQGFDTVWLSDVPMAGTVDPILGVAFAAAMTTRLKLGITIVPFGRTPYVLARELAQLDRLASGRLLVNLVPGLNQAGERDALSIGRRNRGGAIDELIPLLRQWWAGERVTHSGQDFACTDAVLRSLPVQPHLEIWLGGRGPAALERAGRLSDGWLGTDLNPGEAGVVRSRIDEIAEGAGRQIDPEHFGLSIPYARSTPSETVLAAIRARRDDGDLSGVVPVGAEQLRNLVDDLVTEGLSKFALRPIGPVPCWNDELAWLADTLLDKQT